MRLFCPSFDEGFPYVGQQFFSVIKVCAVCQAADEVLHFGAVHGLLEGRRCWRRPRFARPIFGHSFDVVGDVDLAGYWLYIFFVRLFQFVQCFDDGLIGHEAVDDGVVPLQADRILLVGGALLVGLDKGLCGALLGGRFGGLQGQADEWFLYLVIVNVEEFHIL